MLRRATLDDVARIEAMWSAPQNAPWIQPPDEGEVAASVAAGFAFVWETEGRTTGFVVLMTWVPEVFGLSAIVAERPGDGRRLLSAVLRIVFTELKAHRIGFDVTADNTRAIRLYESLGFRREGHIRECWRRPDGLFVDCLLMGLLAREWTP